MKPNTASGSLFISTEGHRLYKKCLYHVGYRIHNIHDNLIICEFFLLKSPIICDSSYLPHCAGIKHIFHSRNHKTIHGVPVGEHSSGVRVIVGSVPGQVIPRDGRICSFQNSSPSSYILNCFNTRVHPL